MVETHLYQFLGVTHFEIEFQQLMQLHLGNSFSNFNISIYLPNVFRILCFPFSKGLFSNFADVFWILCFPFCKGLFSNSPNVFWILCFPFSKGVISQQ